MPKSSLTAGYNKFDYLVPISELKIDAKVVLSRLCGGLKDYCLKSRLGKVVLGLSGGLDSSVTACLAANALGPENVLPLFLPTRFTPKEDFEDATEIAKSLRIPSSNFIRIDMDALVRTLEDIAGPMSEVNRGNSIARLRMVVCYSKAREHAALVLGTSDRSEWLIGYFTKHGDAGVDLTILGGLYKTQVRQLAYAEGLPERIWKKASSPRLWEGHLAEDEIGLPYEVIDPLLFLMVDQKKNPHEAAETIGMDLSIAEKVLRMIESSSHKRNMPSIISPW